MNESTTGATTADQEPDLVLEHTSSQGTTLEGSRRGDGVLAALRGTGVYWKPTRDGLLYIPHSRDKAPNRNRIDRAAQAVRELGFTVSVTIDATPRDAATVRADKHDDALQRAEHLDSKAARLSGHSTALRDRADQISQRFAGGQPILVGHHSAPKAMRDLEKIHTKNEQARELEKEAGVAAAQADAARHTAESLDNPVVLARRIDKLEADLRGIGRKISGNVRNHRDGHGTVYMQTVTKPAEGTWLTQLHERKTHAEAELAHARELYAEHVRAGRAWGGSLADIKPGDVVKTGVRGGPEWYPVLKVNRSTVTVQAYGFTLKRKHYEIQDHRSATATPNAPGA
ncbi:DUF3560 domain-containing protein [Lentzea sp. CA-135723]|uniref:DUF3560 domain-containing protein n=1 Tax=Lentzea sp. CA-135723 TaxID=3239950 RepID=UPI003D8A9DDC